RNLPADLDDLFGWQSEIVGNVRSVAHHGREDALLPMWHRRPMAAVQNALMPDIIGDVVESDRAATLLCFFKQAGDLAGCDYETSPPKIPAFGGGCGDAPEPVGRRFGG